MTVIESPDTPECFVMMPISDPSDYSKGHFERVYKDILSPACGSAGFRATRADEVQQTNLIQLDMLQRILTAPMALCDLSTRNPNVLFELGLRQAFDKPVVLVREVGTPPIFDIAQLRYTEYRPTRLYHEVMEDQIKISNALISTKEASGKGEGVNSIVRLLALTQPASLPDVKEADRDPVLQILRAELNAIRSEFQNSSSRQEQYIEHIAQQLSQDVRSERTPVSRISRSASMEALAAATSMDALVTATRAIVKGDSMSSVVEMLVSNGISLGDARLITGEAVRRRGQEEMREEELEVLRRQRLEVGNRSPKKETTS